MRHAPAGYQIWDVVIRDNHPDLMRFLGRRVGNTADAGDIAQEAYIRVLGAGIESIDNPRSYLFRTAANLVVDHFRRLNRERNRSAELGRIGDSRHEVEVTRRQAEPEAVVDAKQRLGAIYTALMKLSPKSRRAFVMHRFGGMSYAEIANELGVSKDSVEKYMIEALRLCRRELKNHEMR